MPHPPTCSRGRPAAARPPGRRATRFLLGLAGVVAVGVLLRLAVSAELHAGYPPVTRPGAATDMATYLALAQQLLTGHYDWSQGFYYQPFYYAVFLPAVFKCGGGAWGLILAQTALAGAAIWLTGLAFARLGGRAAGLLGAGLLALARLHIFHTPIALIEVLQSCWLALLLWACLWAAARGAAWWRWAVVGLVLGLAVVTRGNVLLLAPVPLALLAWRLRRRLALALLAAAALLVACYLPQLPFAMANYRALGRWVGPSSAGPAVLALGNTPEAPPGGRDPDSGAGPMEYPASYAHWRAQAEARGPERVSLAANVAAWLRREPLAWPELKWRTFLLFWHRAEIPNNVALRDAMGAAVPSRVLWLPVLLDFWVLGALGLTGLLLACWRARRRPGLAAAAGLLWLYCGSIVLFYMLARFRLPAVPWMCGFGGLALAWLWRWYRAYQRRPGARARRRVVVGLVTLPAALLVVGAGYDVYRYGCEAAVLRLARPHGVRVDLGDRAHYMDNGPYSFGGWTPVPLAAGATVRVRKELAVQERAAPTYTVRLPVLARAPVTLTVGAGVNGEAWRGAVEVKPPAPLNDPAQWVVLTLPAAAFAPIPGGLALDLALTVPAGTSPAPLLVVDTQRVYGRTSWPSGTAVPAGVSAPAGELVLHLEVPK